MRKECARGRWLHVTSVGGNGLTNSDVSQPFSYIFLSELSGKHDSVFTMSFPLVLYDDRLDLVGSFTLLSQKYSSPIR